MLGIYSIIILEFEFDLSLWPNLLGFILSQIFDVVLQGSACREEKTFTFGQKKWVKGPPPKKIISKNYFFSNSISSIQIVIPWWTAGGVCAL